MKKRSFSLILALALLCTLLPRFALPASAETITGTCGGEGDGSNLTWSLDDESGVLTIEGSGRMADYDLSPWSDHAGWITGVSLPDGLANIGNAAFASFTALTDVSIPSSVTSIGEDAFSNCGALAAVTIPDGVVTIRSSAFVGCDSLTAVQIPDSVTYVAPWAFGNCTALRSVSIGNGVTDLDKYAFYSCSALTELSLGSSVTGIGDWAFYNCDALQFVTIPTRVARIGECAFGYRYDTELHKDVKIDGFLVCGGSGSVAQAYAATNGFCFVAADRFADVSVSDYYFKPVMWAVSRNPVITAGVDDTHFGPENPCTREQIVTFLWKAAGAPRPTAESCGLSDVQPGSYYYDAVLWATEKGVTSGMGDGSFGVGLPCTRAQAMTFLWVSQDRPAPTGGNPFTDVEDGMWYYDPIRWAVEHRVTAGMGDGSFGVEVTCTRAQIITFLYKAFTMPKT